jgi:transcription elongation factor GreA
VDRSPITREGYGRIREELERLKREDRVKISKEISVARSHGDISENAEYHAAREKQGWIEAKIRNLETRLASSEIVDVPKGPRERVAFGVKVRLEDLDSGEEKVYSIVGPHEANIDEGTISITSPLARATLGKQPGDEVVVEAPGRTKEYEILEIFD